MANEPGEITFANREKKDKAMAEYFVGLGYKPHQIALLMPHAYNEHVREAGFRPSSGKGYSRSHKQAVADVQAQMRKALHIPESQEDSRTPA